MKLSKTTLKNPTQTKTLSDEYARTLRHLFTTYRKGALNAINEAAAKGTQMLTESKLIIEETHSSLEIINKDEIEHINDLEEYDRRARWDYVPRVSTLILTSDEIDLIFLDETLRELGIQLITAGVGITADYARKSYKSGTTYGTFTLKRIGVEAVIGDGPADWRVVDALKVRNLSALRGITDEMNKQIIRELTDGVQLGESIPKLAARLTDRVDKIGKTRATMMARTETINAFTQGAELRYAQAGIKTLEWLTAHDSRTCNDCLELDGKQFSIKSAHVRPPLHPNCRCSLLPVID